MTVDGRTLKDSFQWNVDDPMTAAQFARSLCYDLDLNQNFEAKITETYTHNNRVAYGFENRDAGRAHDGRRRAVPKQERGARAHLGLLSIFRRAALRWNFLAPICVGCFIGSAESPY